MMRNGKEYIPDSEPEEKINKNWKHKFLAQYVFESEPNVAVIQLFIALMLCLLDIRSSTRDSSIDSL